MGSKPYPLLLKQYLLATGERGLGWDVVQRLPARTFHQLWVMSHVVAKVSTQEGRDDLNKERAIRTVIRHEHDPAPAPVIIDTERMTAEQIAELSHAYR